MKSSLLLTLLICAGFAGFHWSRSVERTGALRERAALEEAVSAAGYDPRAAAQGKAVALDSGGAPPVPADGSRAAESDRDARALARELIAMAAEQREMRESGREVDEDMRRRMFATLTKFSEMDRAGIGIMVGEVTSAPDVSDDVRREVLGGMLSILAQRDPSASLDLLDDLGEGAVGKEVAQMVRAISLSKLAERNPAEAAEWIAAREAKGEEVSDSTKDQMIGGIADADPALAIRYAADAGRLDDVASRIGMAARSDGERTAALTALRAHLDSAPDENGFSVKQQFFAGLATGLVESGVDGAAQWIDAAGLTEAERDAATDGLLGQITSSEPVHWLAWMQETIPEDKLASKMQLLVPSWTQNDYNAVANWLNDQPEGPIRDSAALSFATTLSQHEPEAAATWALTLPDNPERRNLLQRIYRSWRERDPGAAGEFARGQGISE